jgi:hypothetical protein
MSRVMSGLCVAEPLSDDLHGAARVERERRAEMLSGYQGDAML